MKKQLKFQKKQICNKTFKSKFEITSNYIFKDIIKLTNHACSDQCLWIETMHVSF